MLFFNSFKMSIVSASAVIVLFSLSQYYGCSSDSSTNTTTTQSDPNVVSFDSVDIYPASAGGVDLYLGKNIMSGPQRDMSVVSSGLTGNLFYFQSGDVAGGYRIGFTLVDSTLSKAGYESISTVAGWGSSGAVITDTASFLAHSNTSIWGNLSNPPTIYPVYGFYLQGRFLSGATANRIFGLIHVNSISGGGATAVKINISIRYNKAGLNKF